MKKKKKRINCNGEGVHRARIFHDEAGARLMAQGARIWVRLYGRAGVERLAKTIFSKQSKGRRPARSRQCVAQRIAVPTKYHCLCTTRSHTHGPTHAISGWSNGRKVTEDAIVAGTMNRKDGRRQNTVRSPSQDRRIVASRGGRLADIKRMESTFGYEDVLSIRESSIDDRSARLGKMRSNASTFNRAFRPARYAVPKNRALFPCFRVRT